MDQILKFFHSEHDVDILGFELQIIQDWLVVDPPSKLLYSINCVVS